MNQWITLLSFLVSPLLGFICGYFWRGRLEGLGWRIVKPKPIRVEIKRIDPQGWLMEYDHQAITIQEARRIIDTHLLDRIIALEREKKRLLFRIAEIKERRRTVVLEHDALPLQPLLVKEEPDDDT